MEKKLTRMLSLPAWAFESLQLKALQIKITEVLNDPETSPASKEEIQAIRAIEEELAFRGWKLKEKREARERFIDKFGTD